MTLCPRKLFDMAFASQFILCGNDDGKGEDNGMVEREGGGMAGGVR